MAVGRRDVGNVICHHRTDVAGNNIVHQQRFLRSFLPLCCQHEADNNNHKNRRDESTCPTPIEK
jgi:hypothetical protein